MHDKLHFCINCVMSFLSEISKFLLDNSDVVNGYNIINYASNIVYIDGFKRLLSLYKDKIRLKMNKEKILIVGTDLKIVEMSKNVIIIKGKIKNIEVEDEV